MCARARVCVCACMCVFLCARVRACAFAILCFNVCVCVCVCVFVCVLFPHNMPCPVNRRPLLPARPLPPSLPNVRHLPSLPPPSALACTRGACVREPRALQCGARARAAAHGRTRTRRPPALPRAIPIPSKAAPGEPPDPSPPSSLPTLCATAWMHGSLHQPPVQCPEAPAPQRTVRVCALKYIPPGPPPPTPHPPPPPNHPPTPQHTYAHLPSTPSRPPVCPSGGPHLAQLPLLRLCVHVP